MSVSADKPRLTGKTGLWLALKRVVPLMFLCVLPIAVLAFAAAMFWHRGTLGIDFRGELYPEAELILHGQNPFPDPDADLSGGVNRIFPVAAAALVSPLTVLPVGAAAAVFAFVLLVALGATLAVLGVRDWRVYGAVAVWPASIAAIQTGNLTILLGLLVALAWRWRNRMLLPGVAIGLAIVLKLFLWPLVVWLLAIHRYAAAATAAGLAAVGTLLVLPFMALRDYAHLMSNLGDTFGDESYNLVGLLQQSGIAGLSAAHLTATVVGLAVLAFAYRERSLPLALAASLVLSPIVWMNYLVLLAVPLAIARPRFGLVWLAPLVLVVCPGTGEDVRLRHIVIGLLLLAFVTGYAERARRRTGDGRAPLLPRTGPPGRDSRGRSEGSLSTPAAPSQRARLTGSGTDGPHGLALPLVAADERNLRRSTTRTLLFDVSSNASLWSLGGLIVVSDSVRALGALNAYLISLAAVPISFSRRLLAAWLALVAPSLADSRVPMTGDPSSSANRRGTRSEARRRFGQAVRPDAVAETPRRAPGQCP